MVYCLTSYTDTLVNYPKRAVLAVRAAKYAGTLGPFQLSKLDVLPPPGAAGCVTACEAGLMVGAFMSTPPTTAMIATPMLNATALMPNAIGTYSIGDSIAVTILISCLKVVEKQFLRI
jgi:hypothetical protein